MNIFNQEDIKRYKEYFDVPEVLENANKLFDIVKDGEEILNNNKLNENENEKMASLILACIKLQEYYNKGDRK